MTCHDYSLVSCCHTTSLIRPSQDLMMDFLRHQYHLHAHPSHVKNRSEKSGPHEKDSRRRESHMYTKWEYSWKTTTNITVKLLIQKIVARKSRTDVLRKSRNSTMWRAVIVCPSRCEPGERDAGDREGRLYGLWLVIWFIFCAGHQTNLHHWAYRRDCSGPRYSEWGLACR